VRNINENKTDRENLEDNTKSIDQPPVLILLHIDKGLGIGLVLDRQQQSHEVTQKHTNSQATVNKHGIDLNGFERNSVVKSTAQAELLEATKYSEQESPSYQRWQPFDELSTACSNVEDVGEQNCLSYATKFV